LARQAARKPKRPTRGGLIAALDVGTSKVCCAIARVEDEGRLRVIGLGHQVSQGVKAGAVVDMEAAETCIGAAVHEAEQMAGETVRSVFVAMSGGYPHSQLMSAEVAIHGAEITEADIRRARAQARGLPAPPDSTVLHAIPVAYTVDGIRGVTEPKGMFGDRLGMQVHVVSAHAGAVRNLQTCVNRCHLDIEGIVAGAYASGLSALVEDEKKLGVTCIDMGGGATSISVFIEDQMVWADSIPVGGSHVTADLAHGLGASLAEAERQKTLHGNTIPGVTDDREMLNVLQIGEDDRPSAAQSFPKSMLVRIIRPRMEEIFEMVRARLSQSGYGRLAGRRLVLTGGASQLTGAAELAQKMLDKQVRLGRPTRVAGLADAKGGPAFATIAGVLLHALHSPVEAPVIAHESGGGGGIWSRVGLWLKENL
jgi:cell division protein FtsA